MDPSLTGRETVGPDLGSVLMDQRMRADKHRMNFEALRSQYIVLQEVGGVRWRGWSQIEIYVHRCDWLGWNGDLKEGGGLGVVFMYVCANVCWQCKAMNVA